MGKQHAPPSGPHGCTWALRRCRCARRRGRGHLRTGDAFSGGRTVASGIFILRRRLRAGTIPCLRRGCKRGKPSVLGARNTQMKDCKFSGYPQPEREVRSTKAPIDVQFAACCIVKSRRIAASISRQNHSADNRQGNLPAVRVTCQSQIETVGRRRIDQIRLVQQQKPERRLYILKKEKVRFRVDSILYAANNRPSGPQTRICIFQKHKPASAHHFWKQFRAVAAVMIPPDSPLSKRRLQRMQLLNHKRCIARKGAQPS